MHLLRLLPQLLLEHQLSGHRIAQLRRDCRQLCAERPSPQVHWRGMQQTTHLAALVTLPCLAAPRCALLGFSAFGRAGLQTRLCTQA